MNTQSKIQHQYEQYVMPTYAPSLLLVRGKGTKVWDSENKEYLDFIAGLAVSSLGHCHPKVIKAMRDQTHELMHVSNLFYNCTQPKLAKELSQKSLGGKCFFCNSGAEANETLIKLARLWGKPKDRYEIITVKNSFHGRTLTTLTATGQTKVQVGFEPLPKGFVHAQFNDIQSCKDAINERTVAILVEPIQGEGGIIPAQASFMRALRDICDQNQLLLLCDEIQCGLGRTGHWFCYQAYGIEPDAISLAKGLGSGFPIGAVVSNKELADVFQPGHHGSTFGGAPLACAVALAVLEVINEKNLVHRAQTLGAYFIHKLQKLSKKYAFIKTVRGSGLMIGLVLHESAKPLEESCRQKGLLGVATSDTTLRFLPPLTVKKSELTKAIEILDTACSELDT